MKIPLDLEIDLDPGDEFRLRFEPSHHDFPRDRNIPATVVLSLKRDGAGTAQIAIHPKMIEDAVNVPGLIASYYQDARVELLAAVEAQKLVDGEPGGVEPREGGILGSERPT